jgi:acyl-CoA thioester hydrolase
MADSSEPIAIRWPVSVEIPVAWGDMDAFGHVNNTVYLRWFETARIAYFETTGLVERMKRDRIGPILARTAIDFRIPLEYPDTVRASARVSSFGKTSFVMQYRVTSAAHQHATAAEGEGVIVLIDYAKGGKVAIDDATRSAIEKVEASAE